MAPRCRRESGGSPSHHLRATLPVAPLLAAPLNAGVRAMRLYPVFALTVALATQNALASPATCEHKGEIARRAALTKEFFTNHNDTGKSLGTHDQLLKYMRALTKQRAINLGVELPEPELEEVVRTVADYPISESSLTDMFIYGHYYQIACDMQNSGLVPPKMAVLDRSKLKACWENRGKDDDGTRLGACIKAVLSESLGPNQPQHPTQEAGGAPAPVAGQRRR
jgi:hypothetical protein